MPLAAESPEEAANLRQHFAKIPAIEIAQPTSFAVRQIPEWRRCRRFEYALNFAEAGAFVVWPILRKPRPWLTDLRCCPLTEAADGSSII